MKYKVTLHVLSVGDNQQEFEELQQIVDRLAQITDFRVILNHSQINAQNTAKFMQMLPESALSNFLPPNENDITHKDVYGQE